MDVTKLKMALRHCPIASCQTCVYFSDKGCTVHEDALKYITQLEARLAVAEGRDRAVLALPEHAPRLPRDVRCLQGVRRPAAGPAREAPGVQRGLRGVLGRGPAVGGTGMANEDQTETTEKTVRRIWVIWQR